jgi:hypothetical protein
VRAAARGAPGPGTFDDGTIAPTAAGGSLPFTPEYSVPTLRYWFMKQFCNLTPRRARALAAESSRPDVLLTAFGDDETGYTLHIANLGAAREATLAGIPTTVKALFPVLSDNSHAFHVLPPVTLKNGACELSLSPLSLLTLRSMPVAAGF